jgi:hypothetical protein
MSDEPSPNTSAGFDGIHRRPANRDAANLLGGGEHYRDGTNFGSTLHWETPPPMRPVPLNGSVLAARIIGRKFGRLTVIGLHATVANSWVVRCDCGDYETRKYKALRNPLNVDDKCRRCSRLYTIRKRHERDMKGQPHVNPPDFPSSSPLPP